MDDYTALAGPSIVAVPHGTVRRLSPKRKIGERKRQKKNGKGQGEKEEEVIIDEGLHEALEKQDALRTLEKDKDPSADEEAFVPYGKILSGKKQKRKIDVTI